MIKYSDPIANAYVGMIVESADSSFEGSINNQNGNKSWKVSYKLNPKNDNPVNYGDVSKENPHLDAGEANAVMSHLYKTNSDYTGNRIESNHSDSMHRKDKMHNDLMHKVLTTKQNGHHLK